MNRIRIGSDCGLSPIRQATIQTNAELLSIEPLGTNFSETLIKIQNKFIRENAFENIVCEMATILCMGSWDKLTTKKGHHTIEWDTYNNAIST